MSCNAYCVGSIPAYTNPACQPALRAGGAPKVIFADCDIEDYITDLTDATMWQDAIDAGQVVIVQNVLGDLAAPSDTTALISSALLEVVTQRQWTLNVQDYNVEQTTTAAFWDDILQNSANRKFAFVDGAGKVHAWADDVTSSVALQIPNDKRNSQFFGGAINWLSLTHLPTATFPTTLSIP